MDRPAAHAGAPADGAPASQHALRRMVREEVLQSVEERSLVEAALTRSLNAGKWVEKIEAAVMQFLKTDFDKVLALGADAYHFRRWDELQAEFQDLRHAVGMKQRREEVPHVRELVRNVHEQHASLSSEVAALRECLDSATERLEALEGHNKLAHERLEGQKAFHLHIMEGHAGELREELRKDTTKFSASFWKELGRVEKDVEALHQDRQWLHRQEEALSNRTRDLERRLADGAVLGKEVTLEAKSEAKQLSARIDETHASLQQWLEQHQERAIRDAEDREKIRTELQDRLSKFQGVLEDGHAQQQSRHAAFVEAAEERLHGTFHAQLTENTTALGLDLSKAHAENRMLHEKLQVAVLKGYEAVEDQFRERLEQQVSELRVAIADGLTHTQADQLQQHAELRRTITRLEEGATDVEFRISEALHQQIESLGTNQQRGHSCIQADLEALSKALHEKTSELGSTREEGHANVRAELQALRDELAEHAENSSEASKALDSRLRTDMLAKCGELVEVQHWELRGAMLDYGEAIESKLSEAMAEKLSRHKVDSAERSCKMSQGAEDTVHKLFAMAYSLLEVIGEMQLSGSQAEAKAKRDTLHNRLCDRLGASRAWNDWAPESPEEPKGEASRGSAARSPVPPSRLSGAPPALDTAPGDDRPRHLPPVHKPTAPGTPKTARGGPRFSDSLRDIRTLRLADYTE